MTKLRVISTIAMALLVVLLVFVASATAAQVTRTVPSECVGPGDDFTVTIDAPGVGVVFETLCDGWTFKGSSLDSYQVSVSGNVVTFTLMGDTSFTYTVEAPNTPNTCCTISGIYRDMDQIDHTIDDDTVCTCPETTSETATRTVPSDCVGPGDDFTVTIDSAGVGVVFETLCDGWTYKGSSLDSYQVSVSGNVVTFSLMGDTSFTYTVEAPDTPEACCTISGIYRDMDQIDHTINDDTVCTCSETQPETATRTVPSDCIDPGDDFTVTIDSAGVGVVFETLCDGWTYKGSSLDSYQVSVSGNVVTFSLAGDTSFTYTVEAPDTPDECCTISGIYRDMDQIDHTINDDTVCTCSLDNPRPRITDPSDGATVSGIITIVEEDLSGQDDIVYNLFEYRSVSGTTWTEIGNDTNGSDGWWVLWNTKAVANGSYYIRATMGDNESLTGSDQISVTVDNPPQYGISLESGWNFISVPCVLDNDTVEHVLDGVDYEAIVWYDASDQTWYIPSDIVPLTAYGIKVNESQVIENIECEVDEFGLPNSRQMYAGWNPVGLTGLVPRTAEYTFYLGDIDENYSKVWGPYKDGDYKQHGFNRNIFGEIPYPGEEPPDVVYTGNYSMEPYQGHWIYMTSDAVLSAIV